MTRKKHFGVGSHDDKCSA